MQSQLRQIEARENLNHKLMTIQNDEINASSNYMSDMPSMLKKLYLTLKGYDKAPPALTHEYLELMKKAKSAKSITWSDQDSDTDSSDVHFKFISTLTLDKPTTAPDFNFPSRSNDVIDVVTTDSDELTDIENREPNQQSGKKRKGTPIKLANNDTIIIDDSFESLDTTRTMLSAKKVKRELNAANDVENYPSAIDPMDLNSTFVLAGKMEALKKQLNKQESVEAKKGLTDRTNVMAKTLTFGYDKGEIVFCITLQGGATKSVVR